MTDCVTCRAVRQQLVRQRTIFYVCSRAHAHVRGSRRMHACFLCVRMHTSDHTCTSCDVLTGRRGGGPLVSADPRHWRRIEAYTRAHGCPWCQRCMPLSTCVQRRCRSESIHLLLVSVSRFLPVSVTRCQSVSLTFHAFSDFLFLVSVSRFLPVLVTRCQSVSLSFHAFSDFLLLVSISRFLPVSVTWCQSVSLSCIRWLISSCVCVNPCQCLASSVSVSNFICVRVNQCHCHKVRMSVLIHVIPLTKITIM